MTLALDIRSAYDVPELKKLERSFTFRRAAAASLAVRDEVEFSTPQRFETALISWGKSDRVSDHELVVRDDHDAVRVNIDAAGRPFEIKSETLEEDVRSRTRPVRIGIALKSPVQKGIVILTISVESSK